MDYGIFARGVACHGASTRARGTVKQLDMPDSHMMDRFTLLKRSK